MKKRILACVIACTLLLGGCTSPLDVLTLFTNDTYDCDKYLSEYEDRWQYSTLTAEEKEFYGCLYTAVTDTMAKDVHITYTDEQNQSVQIPGVRVEMDTIELTHDRIIHLYEAFFDDNPQFFYLDRTYSLEGRQKPSGTTYYNTLILQYSLSATQRQNQAAKLNQTVETILAGRPVTDDEYITELYLHDQLNTICTYDTEAADNDAEKAPNAYTAYGALVEGKAVCEGYAKAIQLLLQRVDIPATLTTGTAKENNESHMWNLVTIHGQNYFLDATWNDIRDQGQHTFFNITTEQMLASCMPDDPSELPLCTATADNIFIRTQTMIDTYERQTIAQKIADRIREGDTTVQLCFEEGKYENGVLFLKNKNLLTSMVNGFLVNSQATMWEYELWADTAQRVLTLVKK